MPETGDTLAERAAAAMWAKDRASSGLGMRLDAIEAGRARLSMPVVEAMLNGHDICHGGFIFTLADSAFAFACNSHNAVAVAHSCEIVFLAPGRLGDVLIADAVERRLMGRSGVYDVTVTTSDGRAIAEFRGQSRTLTGQHVEPESNP
jgi:acyl-CoA thioesterase